MRNLFNSCVYASPGNIVVHSTHKVSWNDLFKKVLGCFLMRYVSLLFAYAIVALLLGVAFLFPERPFTLTGFAIIIAALTPVVGGFDVVGQAVIDSHWVKGNHQGVRALLGLMVLAAFLATLYTVLQLVAVPTIAW